jgi:hypothetical protein
MWNTLKYWLNVGVFKKCAYDLSRIYLSLVCLQVVTILVSCLFKTKDVVNVMVEEILLGNWGHKRLASPN